MLGRHDFYESLNVKESVPGKGPFGLAGVKMRIKSLATSRFVGNTHSSDNPLCVCTNGEGYGRLVSVQISPMIRLQCQGLDHAVAEMHGGAALHHSRAPRDRPEAAE